MKRKTIILITIVILIILSIVVILSSNKNNLIKLSYNEVVEKINNKESFVLCISATYCSHCQDYKPKLKNVANDYNILIYYIDIDKLDEKEYINLKKELSLDGSTPITIFFKNGEEATTATRIEGDVKTEKIIEKLKANGFINE